MNVKIGVIKLTVFLIVVFIVGIPVLSVFLPSIEVLTIYPLLISLILSLLTFAYKMMKSEKSLEMSILGIVAAILILFWLVHAGCDYSYRRVRISYFFNSPSHIPLFNPAR